MSDDERKPDVITPDADGLISVVSQQQARDAIADHIARRDARIAARAAAAAEQAASDEQQS